ncbi:MAG: lipopolysaccharide heptosyltransferase II [Desulfobacteraceae bacterium]|nr:lipopolysaccharide heptosyltransferase II [Desulfobacteraceae bacterium]
MMNHRNNIKKLLVRGANWVGDAVMTTPAMRALRKGFPGARITLLVKPWVGPVFENNPNIDDLMIYKADGRHKGPFGLLRLVRDLRRQNFDAALLFQNAFEAALLSWLAAIPFRAGYTTDGRTLLLTERIHNWRLLKKGHLIDYYLGLPYALGIGVNGRKLEITLTKQETLHARQTLNSLGVMKDQIILGFNPGAAHGTAKRWPVERYAALGKALKERFDARIVIFGSPGEAGLGQALADKIGDGCSNLAGATTLRQAMALIGLCNLFITNDSGLMHVAAALDVPQVAVIGPTDPIATGPSNPTSLTVQAKGSCKDSPCLLPDCPIHHPCMTAVTVDQVLSAALSLMDNANS